LRHFLDCGNVPDYSGSPARPREWQRLSIERPGWQATLGGAAFPVKKKEAPRDLEALRPHTQSGLSPDIEESSLSLELKLDQRFVRLELARQVGKNARIGGRVNM
jgi:hypothetical protein